MSPCRKNGFYLLHGRTWIIVQEFLQTLTSLQIIEEHMDGQARTPEANCPADSSLILPNSF